MPGCECYRVLRSSKYDDDVPDADLPYKAVNDGMIEYTTSHGIPHVAARAGILKKVIWILVSLAAFGMMCYHLYTILSSWLEYSTTMSVDIVKERFLTFPAVTVCNMNAYRLTQVNAALSLQNNLQANGSDLNDHKTPQSGLGSKRSSVKIQQQFDETVARLSKEDQFQLGHQKNDFLLDCQFEGYECSYSNFESFVDPAHGNCFVFNSGLNDSATLFTSAFSGPDYGLRLIFNIEQNEYLGQFTSKAGVRVVIHPQTTMPFPEDSGVSIGPGLSTAISIREVSLTRLSGKYGTCEDTTVRNFSNNVYSELYNGVNYTVEACFKTCYQRELIKKCNCFDYKIPSKGAAFGNVNVHPCESQNQTQAVCADEFETSFSNGSVSCYCPNPCEMNYFEQTVSSVIWPADGYRSSLFSELSARSNKAKGVISAGGIEYTKNFAQLEVYFEELNVQKFSEQPSYEDGQFWSDLGGSVGLWVGASIITLFEFFEYLIDLIMLCCLKSRNASVRKPKPTRSNESKSNNVQPYHGSHVSLGMTQNLRDPHGLTNPNVNSDVAYS